MPIVTIDSKEYEFDTLPQIAKEQLQSLQFVDAEIARLQAKAAILRTARASYANALNEALGRIEEPAPFSGDTIKLG